MSADATSPVSRRVRWRLFEERVVLDDGDAGKQVVVAGEDLRGAVQRDVAALFEREQAQRR